MLSWIKLGFVVVVHHCDMGLFCYLQEEPKEESDDDMGFSLFD